MNCPHLAILLLLIASPLPLIARDLYVDPSRGDDQHSGTKPERALRTIEAARDLIRRKKLNREMTEDLQVHLRGGRYELRKTLEFDARDSGNQGHRVIYRNYKNELPLLCGGKKISDWKKVAGEPYYQADASSALARSGYFRQLYVDGIRAQRARSHTFLQNTRDGWADDPSTPERGDGFFMKEKGYNQVEDLEVFYSAVFKVGYLPVEALLRSARPVEMVVKMRQPYFGEWLTWGHAQRNPKLEFMIVNAMEELDEPGEWYVNRKTKKIYYYPTTPGQDMATVEAWVPMTEFLLRIKGEAKHKVKDLTFKGLHFRYGNWGGPEHRLLGKTQAEIDLNYTSEIPGQIIIDHAKRVTIRDCRVTQMASVGVQLYEACDEVLIEGNVFDDLTAAAVSVGRWYLNKMDCPSETICRNTMVRNNVVRNTGRDFEQATGLNVFAAHACKFHHNDVSDTAYTGIHARIGDTGAIRDDIGAIEFKWNKVSRSMTASRYGMDDGGHLYLHGRYPGSVVEGNFSLYTTTVGHHVEFYSDNWAHSIHWIDNVSRYSISSGHVCRASHHAATEVIYENTYSDRNSKGTSRAKLINYVWVKDGQWPPEALKIMENAGLQPAYRHLLKTVTGHRSLSEGRPLLASSSLGDNHRPAAANDRDWNTFWHTRAGGDGEGWLMVDLGETFMIRRLEILPRQDMFQDHARMDFEVQGSNDPSFETYDVLAEQNDQHWYHAVQDHPSNLWVRYLNPHQAYRYLRAKSRSQLGAFNLAEFDAFGFPAPGEDRAD